MKQFLTVIIIFFLCILGGMAWYFFTQTSPAPSQTIYTPADENTFFPYGDQLNSNATINEPTYNYDTISVPSTDSAKKVAERLFQISLEPVAGFSTFVKVATGTKESNGIDLDGKLTQIIEYSTSTTELVRFVERAKGHLYDATIATTNYNLSREKKATTTVEVLTVTTVSTIPKINRERVIDITSLQPIYYAWPATNLIQMVTQTLSTDLETIQTRLTKITPADTVVATNTEQDIAAIAAPKVERISYPANTMSLAYNGDKVFYLLKESTGARGYIASGLERKDPALVFSSVLSDFNITWPGGDWITLTTKPHSRFTGMTYLINWKTGVEKHLFSNVKGLTAITNYDGSLVLYSASSTALSLNARSMLDYSDVRLPIYTMPEKCAMSRLHPEIAYCAAPYFIDKSYNYPEHWYQGLVSFNDVLWQVNLATGETKIVYDPITAKEYGFDMIEVKLSEDEQFFYFQDKTTLTLWGIWLLDDEEILERTA